MNKNILLPFVCLCFLTVDLYFFSYSQLGVYCGLILIISFVYLNGYSISSPISLLLFGVVFFNARPFLDVIFGTTTFGDTNGFFKQGTFDKTVLTNAFIYIKCSIIAFMFGMLKIRTEKSKNSYNVLNIKASNKYFDMYMVFIYIPTLIAVTYLIILCHFNGGYAYFNSGETVVIVLRVFIPLITVCLSLNLVFFKRNYLTISLIILGVAVSGLIGARLLGLMPILCFMVYSGFYHRKIYSRIFPLVVITIILFTVVVNYYRAGNSITNDTDYMFYLKFFLNEISFTSNLMPMSFEYTSVHDYTFGVNYLGALASLIPKLAFWMKLEPNTYSYSSALGLFYNPEAIYGGFGLNGSLLGESFFSFGYFGIIYIYLFSILVRKLFEKIGKSNEWTYIVLTSSPYLLTSFIFESTIVFRSIFYYSILPVVVFYIFNAAMNNFIKVSNAK